MTVPLRADLRPRRAPGSTPLPDYARDALARRLESDTVDRVAAALDVVPQTVRRAVKGAPLTRSVCGWIVVSLGFPRPAL